MRDYPSLKPVWKRLSNNEYETNHSAYGPVIICNHTQSHCSDSRICEMMTLNDTCNINLFFQQLASLWKVLIRKTCSCLSNQLGDKHRKLVKVVYNYIEKESRRLQSQNHTVTASYLFDLSRNRNMHRILYTLRHLSCVITSPCTAGDVTLTTTQNKSHIGITNWI
jgi:hypothetical protein